MDIWPEEPLIIPEKQDNKPIVPQTVWYDCDPLDSPPDLPLPASSPWKQHCRVRQLMAYQWTFRQDILHISTQVTGWDTSNPLQAIANRDLENTQWPYYYTHVNYYMSGAGGGVYNAWTPYSVFPQSLTLLPTNFHYLAQPSPDGIFTPPADPDYHLPEDLVCPNEWWSNPDCALLGQYPASDTTLKTVDNPHYPGHDISFTPCGHVWYDPYPTISHQDTCYVYAILYRTQQCYLHIYPGSFQAGGSIIPLVVGVVFPALVLSAGGVHSVSSAGKRRKLKVS